MEEVKIWAFAVCAAAICGAILNMMLPEGGAQKTYKAVFCVFFLSVLIEPITEIKIPDFWEIQTETKMTDTEENAFDRISISVIEQKIYEDTAEILRKKGIVAKDISVKVNIFENGSININKFVLTLEEKPKGLSEEIAQKIGIEPEIVISGETENGNS